MTDNGYWDIIRDKVDEDLWHTLEEDPGLAAEVARSPVVRRYFIESEREKGTDVLTGLGSRRAFEKDITREIYTVRRLSRPYPITLSLVDVDDFKDLNAKLGHPGADSVLRKLGAAAKEGLRSSDTAYRFGGDEFAFLFLDLTTEASVGSRPESSMASVTRLRERTRNVLAPYGATLSFGVADYVPEEGLDTERVSRHEIIGIKERLLGIADKALYTIKESGAKGRVCIYTEGVFKILD